MYPSSASSARAVAKRAWSEEHRRLCASAASLELEVGAALGAAHPARAEVERAALALAAPRRALARDLDARASAARRGVAALGGLMREASKGGEGAAGLLARLTTEMDESEAEILAFKESSRAKYEALLKEERDIEAELGAFEQRRARWEDESSSRSASAHVRRAAWAGSSSARPASASSVAAPHGAAAIAAARAQDDTPPEVRAYEAFVAQRGRLGGWDEEDHEMFMKQLKAVGGDYSAVVARAEERLPHIPKEQVLAHARWHAEHEDMLAERRAAIQRWRLRRDMARLGGAKPKRGAKAFGFGSRAPPADEDEDVDTATVAEMELAAQDARRMAAEMKRAEVRAWREEKAAQTARAAQEEERRERRRKEQAERARSSNAVRREAARLYRAEREAQQAAARAREQEDQAEQRATRPKLSKENAMRMHERDLRMAQRKEAAMRAKEEEVEARRRRQARLKASVREEVDKKVKADAGRLMRPTSAHMRRTEEGRESRGLFDNGVTNVRYHSVKATPSWRQMR